MTAQSSLLTIVWNAGVWSSTCAAIARSIGEWCRRSDAPYAACTPPPRAHAAARAARRAPPPRAARRARAALRAASPAALRPPPPAPWRHGNPEQAAAAAAAPARARGRARRDERRAAVGRARAGLLAHSTASSAALVSMYTTKSSTRETHASAWPTAAALGASAAAAAGAGGAGGARRAVGGRRRSRRDARADGPTRRSRRARPPRQRVAQQLQAPAEMRASIDRQLAARAVQRQHRPAPRCWPASSATPAPPPAAASAPAGPPARRGGRGGRGAGAPATAAASFMKRAD